MKSYLRLNIFPHSTFKNRIFWGVKFGVKFGANLVQIWGPKCADLLQQGHQVELALGGAPPEIHEPIPGEFSFFDGQQFRHGRLRRPLPLSRGIHANRSAVGGNALSVNDLKTVHLQ